MNELIETTIPESQTLHHAATTQIVRDLCEDKIKHDPNKRFKRVKILTPVPDITIRRFSRRRTDVQIDFDGARLVKFMGGRKCTARLMNPSGIYELTWEDGKSSGATTRELITDFTRIQ